MVSLAILLLLLVLNRAGGDTIVHTCEELRTAISIISGDAVTLGADIVLSEACSALSVSFFELRGGSPRHAIDGLGLYRGFIVTDGVNVTGVEFRNIQTVFDGEQFSTINVRDSTFRNCTTAIVSRSYFYTAEVRVWTSVFEGNFHSIMGVNVRVYESNFRGNQHCIEVRDSNPGLGVFTDIRVEGCQFSFTRGAYAILSNALHVAGSTFTDNDGIAIQGGGYDVYPNYHGLDVKGCVFARNGRGAVVVNPSDSDVLVYDSLFEENMAVRGGAISVLSSHDSLTVSNCTFKANTAGEGGAIFARAGVMVKNSVFESNRADTRGGALYFGTIYPDFEFYAVDIAGSSFSLNSAGEYGGAAYLTTESTNPVPIRVEINGSSFFSNQAGTEGGALAVNYSSSSTTLTLESCATVYTGNVGGSPQTLNVIYLINNATASFAPPLSPSDISGAHAGQVMGSDSAQCALPNVPLPPQSPPPKSPTPPLPKLPPQSPPPKSPPPPSPKPPPNSIPSPKRPTPRKPKPPPPSGPAPNHPTPPKPKPPAPKTKPPPRCGPPPKRPCPPKPAPRGSPPCHKSPHRRPAPPKRPSGHKERKTPLRYRTHSP